MVRQVNVVPHTHWDREWYKPFPVFRMQLVELVDLLLPELDAGTGYEHFQLDGQMAVVDDYLEIRPEQRDALVELNRTGRVTMGPWYTLPDEFLVSGETLVRDLQLGLAKADEFGGAMEVGYLPDMFGHVAQMPQILSLFGFADAVVWRGIPSAVTTPAFTWEAPDGSRVRAEYLSDGYSNGARLPDTGDDLVRQVEAFTTIQGSLVGDPVLWMNGTDHQLPQTHLGRVVEEANKAQDHLRFTVTSLRDHLDQAPRDELPVWKGEMRSGARTNVLMGTASARVDVKQAAARAERWLERVAEPAAALWLPEDAWPGVPRRRLARRHPQRRARLDLRLLDRRGQRRRPAPLRRGDPRRRADHRPIARPGARRVRRPGRGREPDRPRSLAATVTAIVPGDVAPPDTQQLSVRPARIRTDSLDPAAALSVVTRAALEDPKVSTVSIVEADEGSGDRIATVVADRQPKDIDQTALREQLEAIAADPTVGVVHLEVQRAEATQEVLLRTGPVPGFGWRGLAPAALGDHAVRASGGGLSNGHVTVEVDQSDGTFSV